MRGKFWLLFLTSLLPMAGSVARATPSGLWLDVPYIHQETDGCGSASLAMILAYWNLHDRPVAAVVRDPAEIQRVLYSRAAHGIYASAMRRYLEEAGFTVFAFRGAWDDFANHLRKGRPLVVALRPGPRRSLHYAVVAGIDSDHVLLNDSARGKLLRVEREEFEKEWRATDHWTLLAVPKSPE